MGDLTKGAMNCFCPKMETYKTTLRGCIYNIYIYIYICIWLYIYISIYRDSVDMVGNNRQYAMGLSWNGGGAHVFCYWIIYMGLAQNWVPDGTRGFEIWWFWVVSHPTFWLFGLTKLNHCSLWLYIVWYPLAVKNSMAKWRACSKPFFWVRGSQHIFSDSHPVISFLVNKMCVCLDSEPFQ